MTRTNAIWVVAERAIGRIQPVTFQLITKARQIANGRPVVAILLEGDDDSFEQQLADYGPDEIIRVRDAKLKRASDRTMADVITALARAERPDSVLFAATPQGRSVAPRVQTQLTTGLTADCLDLRYDDNLLVAVKPSYGDNVMCEITCPQARPQMVSVRPNTFAAERVTNSQTVIRDDDVPVSASVGDTIIDEHVAVSTATGVNGARKVLSLGRGAASDQTVALARQIAAKLGASVGVSRPLTDRDDFSVEQQIGQSGNTIAPELLINVGISGATQYLVGIDQSKLIISVNRDANAPIMAQSDYVYVGDADAFLKSLAKRLGIN